MTHRLLRLRAVLLDVAGVWAPVLVIRADHGIIYATAAGDIEPSSVLGVRLPSPTANRVSGAAGEGGTSTPSGPSPSDSLTGPDGTSPTAPARGLVPGEER